MSNGRLTKKKVQSRRVARTTSRKDSSKEPKGPRLDLTLWVKGKEVRAGAHSGSMVRIDLGDRVLGLRPTASSSRGKRAIVEVFELGSNRPDAKVVRKIRRVSVGYGKIGSAPAEKIRFRVLPSFDVAKLPKEFLRQVPRQKPKPGQCCVNINPGGRPIIICASCYVIHGQVRCCTGFFCCLQMLISIVFSPA